MYAKKEKNFFFIFTFQLQKLCACPYISPAMQMMKVNLPIHYVKNTFKKVLCYYVWNEKLRCWKLHYFYIYKSLFFSLFVGDFLNEYLISILSISSKTSEKSSQSCQRSFRNFATSPCSIKLIFLSAP